MNFSIGFSDDGSGDGLISLGQHMETFQSSTDHFSCHQYKQQWGDALRSVLEERRVTALFRSVDIGDDGVGTLWLYPIVPSELAGDTPDKRKRLSGFPKHEAEGVYIGERFMNVTLNASNFERRIYMEFEDGSKGDELALYYLDLSAPDRFFGYLDDTMTDVSHWYFSNSDLEAFLKA